jgi:hypothetical protein
MVNTILRLTARIARPLSPFQVTLAGGFFLICRKKSEKSTRFWNMSKKRQNLYMLNVRGMRC